jgi:Family of unknown function (DUF6338)
MPAELLPVAILLAIAPGYMTIYFAAHGRTGPPLRPDLHLVLKSLVVSAALLALVGPLAYANLWPVRNDLNSHPAAVAVWMLTIFVVVPFVIGRASRLIVQWVDTNPTARPATLFRLVVPKPVPSTLWDWAVVEGAMEGKFVVIEFQDGHKIGGAHGPPGISLTSPEQHGLFLAVEWELDHNGIPSKPIPNSAGVLVPLDRDVRSIRIIKAGSKGGKSDEQKLRDEGSKGLGEKGDRSSKD